MGFAPNVEKNRVDARLSSNLCILVEISFLNSLVMKCQETCCIQYVCQELKFYKCWFTYLCGVLMRVLHIIVVVLKRRLRRRSYESQ